MKTSEILRSLADMIDKNQSNAGEQEVTTQQDNIDDEVDTFVPPLQAKIELLKKSVGVDNVYDQADAEQEEPACGCDSESESNELDVIKNLAGIPVAAIQEMGDDDPIEG